ncbi:MAG TPA: TetR/AcrR family transcriptional regulator [Thermoleophilaceae bacterium]|nr:TetR/AcrR family transcriptional regulator [Thermoleophilaceae bacterium]
MTEATTTERGSRERILAAAVERIARDGIDEVRIARIAMDAGVSASLVHYHFETREALLEQALEYSYELAGDVRLGPEGDALELDAVGRLAAMIDQFLPYPGLLERDWILWVELWLRAVRHPEMRPTAARLYERMRDWFAHAIRDGIESGEFTSSLGAEVVADRVLALADGYGVRVLFGDMEVGHARREIWSAIGSALGLPDEPPPPLDPENAQG